MSRFFASDFIRVEFEFVIADCVACVAQLSTYCFLGYSIPVATFFFEGPLEYAIDASLDWIAAASLLQATRVKKLGPFRLTSALLNSGVNSLLLLLLSLTFSQHAAYPLSRVHQEL